MEVKYIKALESVSPAGTATINYELHILKNATPPHENVDKVYIQYGHSSAVIDLQNFSWINNGVVVTQIKTNDIDVVHTELDGFSEIVFYGDNGKSKFKVKFSSRDKSFRVMENTLGLSNSTGVLVNKVKVSVPTLNYSQGV